MVEIFWLGFLFSATFSPWAEGRSGSSQGVHTLFPFPDRDPQGGGKKKSKHISYQHTLATGIQRHTATEPGGSTWPPKLVTIERTVLHDFIQSSFKVITTLCGNKLCRLMTHSVKTQGSVTVSDEMQSKNVESYCKQVH